MYINNTIQYIHARMLHKGDKETCYEMHSGNDLAKEIPSEDNLELNILTGTVSIIAVLRRVGED